MTSVEPTASADAIRVLIVDDHALFRRGLIQVLLFELIHEGLIGLVLTGAMIFCADLIRHIPIAMRIGLLAVSSYPGRSVRSQGSRVLGEQLGDLTGRHVLLVDDILDSGGTVRLVQSLLQEAGAAVVRSCVLLRKDRPAAREISLDYVGFDIPDEFVVGYGLDYDDYYRNLPDIVTLKPEALEGRRKDQNRA